MTIYLRPEVMQLSAGLDIDLPDNWLEPVKLYWPAMEKYLEYQVSLSKKELSIITLGRDQAFLDNIELHLDKLGLSSPAIAIFRTLRRQITRATWGVKQSLGPEPELQIYIKKPLPLDQVLWGLKGYGIAEPVAQQIRRVASILKKSHLHFFGVDFTRGRSIPFQVYFTQYLSEDAEVLERLKQVGEQLTLPSPVIEQLIQSHRLSSRPNQTMWISLSLIDGTITPAIKLDYQSLNFELAARLLTTLQFPEATLNYLQTVAETLKVSTADYMGLRLSANAAPTSSIYLTRIK